MVVIRGESISNADREKYLRELHEKATINDEDGREAFVKLGAIASGRNDLPLARELLADLEKKQQ